MPAKISAKSSWSVGQSPKPQWVQIPKRNISTYQLVTGLVKQTLRVKIDLEQASSSGAGMPSQRQAGTTSWLTRLPPKPIKSTNLDRAASKRIFVNLILLILCIACSDVFTLQYHGSMANKQNGICTTTKDKYILWRDMLMLPNQTRYMPHCFHLAWATIREMQPRKDATLRPRSLLPPFKCFKHSNQAGVSFCHNVDKLREWICIAITLIMRALIKSHECFFAVPGNFTIITIRF